jgi:ABC-type cobalt transport system substrate-binding protein
MKPPGMLLHALLTIPLLLLLSAAVSPAAEKWQGIDDSVINKYAAEKGREPKAPLFNTDQGDLLLFVFLLAGAAGGFVAGYYWKTLISGGKKQGCPDEPPKT